MRTVRFIFQLLFLEFILYRAIGFASGASYLNCESYCPMGAVEVLPLFIRDLRYPCAVNELNLAILIGVVALTVLFKRAFCSWVCPLGSIGELISAVRRYFSRYAPAGERASGYMIALRSIALLVIVWGTWVNYDLVFRPFCPYFTAFGLHGHTTNALSYFILANVILLFAFVRMGFCRALCPMGAFLSIFNKKTVFAICRDEKVCNGCGACDAACPSELPVSKLPAVDRVDCTMCLNCVAACRREGSLKVGTR